MRVQNRPWALNYILLNPDRVRWPRVSRNTATLSRQAGTEDGVALVEDVLSGGAGGAYGGATSLAATALRPQGGPKPVPGGRVRGRGRYHQGIGKPSRDGGTGRPVRARDGGAAAGCGAYHRAALQEAGAYPRPA